MNDPIQRLADRRAGGSSNRRFYSDTAMDWRNPPAGSISVKMHKRTSEPYNSDPTCAMEALMENQITTLDMSGTQLDAVGTAKVAEGIAKNKSISQLLLADCAMCIGRIGAQSSFDPSGLQKLAQAISSNPRLTLEVVDWAGNNIGAEGARQVACLFRTGKDLGRRRSRSAKSAQALKEAPEEKHLHTLNLSRNQIFGEGAILIASTLAAKAFMVTNLDLSGNGIGDEAAEALARGIAQNSSLQTLDLRMNNLTNSGARAVAEAVIHRGEGQWHAFNGVLFTDQKQMKAPDIDYSRCNMGPAGVMVLAGWLDRSKLLPTSLVLSDNRLLVEGMEALSRAFRPNRADPMYKYWWSKLTKLDLGGINNIGMPGAHHMGAAVKYLTNLETIVLNRPRVGTVFEIPVKEIRENRVTELDYSDRIIKPEMLVMLADIIRYNNCDPESMERLKVDTLRTVRVGVEFPVSAIRMHELDQLSFADVKLSEAEIFMLCELMTHNTSIQTLDLSGSEISMDAAHCILDTLSPSSSRISVGNQECNQTLEQLICSASALMPQPLPIGGLRRQEETSLSLRCVDLGVIDLVILAGFLKHNTSVTKLDLSTNRLCGIYVDEALGQQKGKWDLSGLRDLCAAIANNPTMVSLGLSNNAIGNEGLSVVCAMLRDNKAMQLSLRSLFLDGNSITDPHMDVLGLLQNLQNLVIMRGNSLVEPLPPWMRARGDQEVLAYMLQYAQGYEPRKEVSFVMVGQSTTNYMHDFLAEFFAGAEKVSRQPCEDKMSVYQWSVPGPTPVSLLMTNHTGLPADKIDPKKMPLKEPHIGFIVWEALHPLPLGDYNDVRCFLCNKPVLGHLSYVLQGARPKKETEGDVADEADASQPFHAKCIPKHAHFQSIVVQWIDKLHTDFPGATVFLVAACTNKTLVDATSAQQVARERRLWDEIVRRERSMVDALIAERRRRDDLQVGSSVEEGERGDLRYSAALVNSALLKREQQIKAQRKSYDDQLQEKLDKVRRSHDEALNGEARVLVNEILRKERMMQDKSMQRERDQTDRTLERLRKIERQIYDEQYWDEVAQVLRDKVDPDKTKRQVGEETSEQLLLERATRSVNGARSDHNEAVTRARRERHWLVKSERDRADQMNMMDGRLALMEQVEQVKAVVVERRRRRKQSEGGLGQKLLLIHEQGRSLCVNMSTGEGFNELRELVTKEAIRLAVDEKSRAPTIMAKRRESQIPTRQDDNNSS